MSNYRFSSAQRYAIFIVHGMKCYMCGHPLALKTMTVDHVLPEHLLATPFELDKAKTTLGLPSTFDVNSFENWMPACSSCNRMKSSVQFEPSPLIQLVLQRLAKKGQEVRIVCEKSMSSMQVSLALSALENANDQGMIDAPIRQKLLHLLGFATDHAYVLRGQPLRLTQAFQLVATTIEDATRWGATHWSMEPQEPEEPALAVLFRAEQGECVQCNCTQQVFQPINQEGGGDPICEGCLSNLDWMKPVLLGDLPTHEQATTSVEQARQWGVTHWATPPRETGEPMLVVLFQAAQGECAACGVIQRVFQPINQEGGGDPICDGCLSELDWMAPVLLGAIPTHVRYDHYKDGAV